MRGSGQVRSDLPGGKMARGAGPLLEEQGALRGIALAWVLTLPATIAISGALYFIFRQFL